MQAAQFTQVGGPLSVVNVPIPNPKKGEVRLKVLVCGICHGDVMVKYSAMGCKLPRIPGHEIVGVIDAIGDGVTEFNIGDLVGVGWFGLHCGNCHACKKNVWVACSNGVVTGLHIDGGYAQYMVTNTEAVAKVPSGLKPEEAAPLVCAGLTTYTALKHSGAKKGDVVVVSGIGGLGHLGVQIAAKMGFVVAAVSNGKDKEVLAKKLGATYYFDSNNPQLMVEELLKLGGAKVVLATAPSAKAIEELIPGLGVEGKIIIVAAVMEPLKVSVLALLPKRQSIVTWASGDARDTKECMEFCAKNGVVPMTETFPLSKANEAFEHMLSNKARFRVVIKIADA